MDLIIKCFNTDDVIAGDKILFNTNNHFHKEEGVPEDYKEILSKGETKNWIDKFHSNYHTIKLDKTDLTLMKQIRSLGAIKGSISEIHKDEFEYVVNRHYVPEGQWFVRSDTHSLKTGMHGAGPYTNIKQIIESICTTLVSHRCFDDDDTECILYLLPWLELDYDKEFRIFVHNNNITAISAQHLYSVNKWLTSLTTSEKRDVIQKIIVYFKKVIREKMEYMQNYTMDLALVNGEPYFIEPNSFGARYASGSSLFHWVNDYDVLYGLAPLELRYCDQ